MKTIVALSLMSASLAAVLVAAPSAAADDPCSDPDTSFLCDVVCVAIDQGMQFGSEAWLVAGGADGSGFGYHPDFGAIGWFVFLSHEENDPNNLGDDQWSYSFTGLLACTESTIDCLNEHAIVGNKVCLETMVFQCLSGVVQQGGIGDDGIQEPPTVHPEACDQGATEKLWTALAELTGIGSPTVPQLPAIPDLGCCP